VLSPDAYTPAPGGVLTRDHAMTTVARDVLKIVKDTQVEVDSLAIPEWSRSTDTPANLVDLRARGGAELADAVARWLGSRAGLLAAPLNALLAADQINELVPPVWSRVCSARTDTADPKALGVFLGRYGLTSLGADALHAWYTSARGLVTTALKDPTAVLQAAVSITNDLGMGPASTATGRAPSIGCGSSRRSRIGAPPTCASWCATA
jgi:hypothetical protein